MQRKFKYQDRPNFKQVSHVQLRSLSKHNTNKHSFHHGRGALQGTDAVKKRSSEELSHKKYLHFSDRARKVTCTQAACTRLCDLSITLCWTVWAFCQPPFVNLFSERLRDCRCGNLPCGLKAIQMHGCFFEGLSTFLEFSISLF